MADENLEKKLEKPSNFKRPLLFIGGVVTVLTGLAIAIGVLAGDLAETRLKRQYDYCQQLKLDAPQYVFAHSYPPKSNYTCLEIEQMYKEFKNNN